MQTIERRIAALEQRDPPPVARHGGETAGAFIARMVATIPAEVLESSPEAMKPWMAALTPPELVDLCESINAIRAARGQHHA